jgi:PAS domain S-box-containing protein
MRKKTHQQPVKSDKKVLIDKEYPFLDGHIIVIWFDQSGLVTSINQSLIDMTGYREKDLVGSSYTMFKHPDFPQTVYDNIKNIIESGKRWKGLLKVLRNDGGYFWGLVTIKTHQREASQLIHLCTVRKPSQRQIALYQKQRQ